MALQLLIRFYLKMCSEKEASSSERHICHPVYLIRVLYVQLELD